MPTLARHPGLGTRGSASWVMGWMGGLLLSALALCGSVGLWPFQAGWLTAKLFALGVYALCGVLAFRVLRDPMAKLGAVAVGLLAFAYSAAVAQARALLPL